MIRTHKMTLVVLFLLPLAMAVTGFVYFQHSAGLQQKNQRNPGNPRNQPMHQPPVPVETQSVETQSVEAQSVDSPVLAVQDRRVQDRGLYDQLTELAGSMAFHRDPFYQEPEKVDPAYALQGIFWSDQDTSSAMINDRIVNIGSRVEQSTVIEIAPDRVVLLLDESADPQGDRMVTLTLSPVGDQ